MHNSPLGPISLFKKILAFTIIVTATPTVSAKTVTYTLSFYSTNTVLIGEGSFSYDDATTDFINTNYFVPSEGFNVNYELTEFNATIEHHSWSGASNHWLADESVMTGELNSNRYGTSVDYGQWFFGDPYFGEDSLILEGFSYQSLTNSWSGVWSSTVNYGSNTNAGTWIATFSGNNTDPTIPIPATIPLFSSGIVLLRLVGRRCRKGQSH